MTNTSKSKNKVKFFSKLIMTLVLILSASTIGGVLLGTSQAFAYSEQVTSLSNLNFTANGNLSSVYANPTGWTKVKDGTGTSGVINRNHHNEAFYISANEVPAKLSDSADDHMLMINSKSSTSSLPSSIAYTNSSSLTLEANSNYKIVVWTKVLPGSASSIYLTGLEETIGFERIDNSVANEWSAYTFYITTGIKSESVKTELWLGSKPDKVASGAVFFDNIEVFKISNNQTPDVETAESNYISTNPTSADNVKYVNLSDSTLEEDFETNLDNWSNASQMQSGAHAEIINLENENTSNAYGIPYLGTDLSKDNKNALMLYTDENVKTYFGLKGKEFTLNMYDMVKVSVNVKTAELSGSAFVKLVEGDILNADGEKVEAISPVSNSIEISSNSTDKTTNNYQTVSFYVKGRSLYNSSLHLELWLGSKENPASGYVAFDNIKTEKISDTEFSAASTGTFVKTVTLQSDSSEYGITNATFNSVKKEDINLTYPLVPNSWTHKESDELDVVYGVVNTYEPAYNAYSANYDNIANPGNPDGFLSTDKDTNNILVMHNINKAYQSITSTKFKVEANKYYKLSFDYKLIETSLDTDLLNIYVKDENGNVLYADENLSSTNFAWSKYQIFVSTNSYTNELTLTISLGTEKSQVKALAYLDNICLFQDKTMTKEAYKELSATENVLDFQEGNFNLVKDNGSSIYEALRFTGKLEDGKNPENGNPVALGGMIDGNNTEDEFDITNSPNNQNSLKYMLLIQTYGKATYSMIASDSLSLSADSYYKFTIDVKTAFAGEDSENSYGAEFSLSGLEEKITGIKASDWTTYTIYVQATSSTTVNLRFALSSANLATAGMAIFDNYSYETIDADTYNVAKLNNSEDNTFLFIGDTDTEEDKDNTSSSTTDFNALWYVIPSLILAAALLLALVAYLMKKVKIKKWEKRKVNEYDRDKTVHRDVIRKKAEEKRDAEVKSLKGEIDEIQKRLEEIEQKHQDRLKDNRQNRRSGVSKEAEKEFKQYAKLHTALENIIVNLNKEIDNKNTAEYLLSVQHKIAIEKAKEERINKEKSFEKNKSKNKNRKRR